MKDLTQIPHIAFIFTHALFGRIGDLCHGLAIALRHLDDHVERFWSAVIHQVGADTETEPHAAIEAAPEFEHARDVETVGEDQKLGSRITLIPAPVLDHLFAPEEGVSGIMTGAVKELAEIHVEVFKEGLHAVDVRKRNPQVAAIFFGPLFEPENLRVAQTGAKRLTGLKVFVRHRAERNEAKLLGKKHV